MRALIRTITPGKAWHTPDDMAARFAPKLEVVGGTGMTEDEALRAQEIRELYAEELAAGEHVLAARRHVRFLPDLDVNRFRAKVAPPIDDGKPTPPGEITPLMCWIERRVRELGTLTAVARELDIPVERVRSKMRSLTRNRLIQRGIPVPRIKVMQNNMKLVDNRWSNARYRSKDEG